MKIPEKAKLVFKGEIFDVYQWQQEMFDGSFETFEMLKRTDTVEVFAIKDGKIMIQEQEQPQIPQPFISLPGGQVEENEDPLSAAKRELLEETGFAGEEWKKLSAYQPYGKIEWSIHLFIVRDCQEIAEQNLDAGEKIKVRWLTFDEFVELADGPESIRMEFETKLEFIRAKYDGKIREDLRKRIMGV